VRASKGGKMLAGGDPSAPIQYIDVRDMAEWVVRMVEKAATGIYNAVGPATPTNLGQIVEAARVTFSPNASVTWVPSQWLDSQHKPGFWGMLLFWQSIASIMQISNERALANGFTTRAIRITLADTLKWYEQQPPQKQESLTTGFEGKKDGSRWDEIVMTWPDYLNHETKALAAWHDRIGRTD